MGGQAGSRGYLIQTLVALLDSLSSGDWHTLTIEPDIHAEKVDLCWTLPTGTRVVQVKSSQNQITLPEARRWAADLEQSISATDYELRLIGPVSSGVTEMKTCGQVRIPTPLPLNLEAFIEQAAHKLDHYLQQRRHQSLRPRARELLVTALSIKLSSYGTAGRPMRREDFDLLLKEWIVELAKENREVSPLLAEVPHELPSPPNDFTGRATELAEFRSAIVRSNCRVAGVRGMPGVGKSIFVAKLAQGLSETYPGGQVYVNLQGTSDSPSAPEAAAAHIIRSFQPDFVAPHSAAHCFAQYRTLLHGRRVLIVAEDAASAEQIEALTPGLGSLLIFTSRQQFVTPGLVPFDLPVLTKSEAIALALSISPRAAELAGDLVHLCGYLPLAIRVCSGTLQTRRDIEPLKFLERLSDASRRLELVESSVDLSVQLLREDAKSLFLQLAVFAGDFDIPALSAIWNRSNDESIQQIGVLLSHSLVEWDDRSKRYRLHDLIRLYARMHVNDEDASRASTAFSSYYLETCREAERLYRMGDEHVYVGLELFDRERRNIEAGFVFAASNADRSDGAAKVCTDYVSASVCCRDLRQPPLERLAWLEAGARAATKVSDFTSIVRHTGNAGRVFRELGRFETSRECHERILKLAQEHGRREDEALAQLQIGLVLGDLQRYADSAERLEISLQIAREVGDVSLQMNALNNLGATYIRLGQYTQARDYLEPALEVLRDRKDPRMLAMVLSNCSQIFMHSSEPHVGVEMLETAVGLFSDLRDAEQFKTLIALGEAYAQVGRGEDALKLFNRCINTAREAGDRHAEAHAIASAGELALAEGKMDEAERRFEVALQLARCQNDTRTQSFVLQHFADLAIARNDRASAIVLLEERLAIAEANSDRHSIAIVSWRLGLLLVSEGQRNRALQIMQRSVDYLSEVRHPQAIDFAEHLRQIKEHSEENIDGA